MRLSAGSSGFSNRGRPRPLVGSGRYGGRTASRRGGEAGERLVEPGEGGGALGEGGGEAGVGAAAARRTIFPPNARKDNPERRTVASMKSVILEALAAYGYAGLIDKRDIEVQAGIFMKRQAAQLRRRGEGRGIRSDV